MQSGGKNPFSVPSTLTGSSLRQLGIKGEAMDERNDTSAASQAALQRPSSQSLRQLPAFFHGNRLFPRRSRRQKTQEKGQENLFPGAYGFW